MTYYDPQGRGVVRITCGGKPLEGTYIPPETHLKQLCHYLARKYGAKDARLPEPRKEAPNNAN